MCLGLGLGELGIYSNLLIFTVHYCIWSCLKATMTFLEIPGVSYIGLGYKRLPYPPSFLKLCIRFELRGIWTDRSLKMIQNLSIFYIFLIFGSLSCEASPQEFWNSFGASLPSTAGAICVRLQE